MAGSLVSNYSQSDSNILEMQLTLDQTRKGKHQVSLTNYYNTSLPAIAAGSVIEVNGALYKFASEDAITGSPSDGTVYIYIDPATITAVFTNTAPTWSDSKSGWYGTTTTANCRYLEYIVFKDLTSWFYKDAFKPYYKKTATFRVDEYIDLYTKPLVATKTTPQSLSGYVSQILVFNSKSYDHFSTFNKSTGKFIAQAKGNYIVALSGACTVNGANLYYAIYINGVYFGNQTPIENSASFSYSNTISLNKNDYMEYYHINQCTTGVTTNAVLTITMNNIYES